MVKRELKNYNIGDTDYSPFKRGLDYQREIFKMSMTDKDYDAAVSSLENIKTEVKNRAMSKQMDKNIDQIEKIIKWYRTIPFRYKKLTQSGYINHLPPTIELRIIQKFYVAFEEINKILNTLKLL